MPTDVRELVDALPARVRMWRGAVRGVNEAGLAWTASREDAVAWARRKVGLHDVGDLLSYEPQSSAKMSSPFSSNDSKPSSSCYRRTSLSKPSRMYRTKSDLSGAGTESRGQSKSRPRTEGRSAPAPGASKVRRLRPVSARIRRIWLPLPTRTRSLLPKRCPNPRFERPAKSVDQTKNPRFRGLSQQGRQDSNLQPPVLETGALPIELRP
jgi:hypothetical protein